jgi:hypothetical protein
MFIIGALLMLLTTVTFMIGGNLEKICQSFVDLSIFSDVCILIYFTYIQVQCSYTRTI